MAASASSVKVGQSIDGVYIVGGIGTFDSAYATGGEVLDISSYLGGVSAVVVNSHSASYRVSHDGGNASAGKVLAWHQANGAQVAANTDLSAVTFGFVAIGQAV